MIKFACSLFIFRGNLIMDKKLGLEIMGSILLDSAMLMVVLLHNLLNGEILSFHSAAPQNCNDHWFFDGRSQH